tara:strand:+ start:3594 stop:4127 length:534 start_codon:yes stop_codon:yes gene_type:complete
MINTEGLCDATGLQCKEANGGYMNDSLIYNSYFYNYLNKKRQDNIAERQDFTNLKTTMKTLSLYEKNFECCKSKYDDGCNFIAKSQEELIDHEKKCLNIIETRPAIEPEYVQCDICNKKFYDKGQKKKPQYSLNAHVIKCKLNKDKNRLKYIQKYLQEGDSETIKNIFFIIQGIENK